AEAQILAQGDEFQEHAEEEVAMNVVPPTPTSPSSSSPVIPSSPPHQSPCPTQPQAVEDKQAEIYNIDLDHSSKVLSMQEDDTEVQEAVEVVTTAKVITEVVTTAATQVAAAKPPIPAAKLKTLKIVAAPAVSTRKRKGVVIRDPEEELHTDTPAETPTVKDKGKGILIKDLKHMKKKDQVEMDAEFDANLKFLFKSREEMEKEDEEIIKSINETPVHKAAKRRKLSEEAQEADDLKKRLKIVQDEDDDVFVKATPLAQKVPVVDYQVVVIDNKPRSKENTKCVSAANEELTAAKHKLMLLI
nr:hypothetical protein [Tanacetum cinerariifolium]